VHFVQMWVVPDTERISPAYEQLDINAQITKGGLVPLASGRGHDAAISIRQKDAVLWVGRLKPGEMATVPDSRFVHVFVPRGAVDIESVGRLEAGDSARLVTARGAPPHGRCRDRRGGVGVGNGHAPSRLVKRNGGCSCKTPHMN
jgi:redox-sensitive bicupin YhaK (pirin superfamily)